METDASIEMDETDIEAGFGMPAAGPAPVPRPAETSIREDSEAEIAEREPVPEYKGRPPITLGAPPRSQAQVKTADSDDLAAASPYASLIGVGPVKVSAEAADPSTNRQLRRWFKTRRSWLLARKAFQRMRQAACQKMNWFP